MRPIRLSTGFGGCQPSGMAGPLGMAGAFRRGRAASMKPRQMAAGDEPPVTPRIGVLSSLPTQTAVTKPPV